MGDPRCQPNLQAGESNLPAKRALGEHGQKAGMPAPSNMCFTVDQERTGILRFSEVPLCERSVRVGFRRKSFASMGNFYGESFPGTNWF